MSIIDIIVIGSLLFSAFAALVLLVISDKESAWLEQVLYVSILLVIPIIVIAIRIILVLCRSPDFKLTLGLARRVVAGTILFILFYCGVYFCSAYLESSKAAQTTNFLVCQQPGNEVYWTNSLMQRYAPAVRESFRSGLTEWDM